MAAQIRLPGRAEPLVIPEPGWAASYPPPSSRHVYAAAHVAATPAGARRGTGPAASAGKGAAGPGDDATIDWEATLRFREHLWAHGFGVAEAMDTAQRGMGLSWEQAQELIARSAERARECGGAIACGAGTDQLADGEAYPITKIIAAYEDQLGAVQSAGADVIVMASRALAASAPSSASLWPAASPRISSA